MKRASYHRIRSNGSIKCGGLKNNYVSILRPCEIAFCTMCLNLKCIATDGPRKPKSVKALKKQTYRKLYKDNFLSEDN